MCSSPRLEQFGGGHVARLAAAADDVGRAHDDELAVLVGRAAASTVVGNSEMRDPERDRLGDVLRRRVIVGGQGDAALRPRAPRSRGGGTSA